MADESRFRYRRDDAPASPARTVREPSPAGSPASRGPTSAAPRDLTPPDLAALPRVVPARPSAASPVAPPPAAPPAAGPAPASENPLAELARLIGDEDPFADFPELPAAGAPAGGAGLPARRTLTEPPAFTPRSEPRPDDWPPDRREVELPPLRYGRRATSPEEAEPVADRAPSGEAEDVRRPGTLPSVTRSFALERRAPERPAPTWAEEPASDERGDEEHAFDDAAPDDEAAAWSSDDATAATPAPQTYDSRIRRAGAALSGGGGPVASRFGSVRDSLLKAPPAPPRLAPPSLPAAPVSPAAPEAAPATLESTQLARDLAAARQRLGQPAADPAYGQPAAAVKLGYGSLSRPTPASPAPDLDAASDEAEAPRATLRRSTFDATAAPFIPTRGATSRFERESRERGGYDAAGYDRQDDARSDHDRSDHDRAAPDDRRDYDDDRRGGDHGSDSAGYAFGAERHNDSPDDAYDDYDEQYDPEFADDGYMPPHGEEVYDAEPRKRRGRMALLLVASLVGLLLAGTAGVFAYRMALGPARTADSGDTPVIRADSAPSKIASAQPAPAPGETQPKLIYDRVGSDAAGKEKMVPREEQPVDVTAAAAAPPPPVETPAGATPANPAEPKRVRTLTVRADGSMAPVSTGDAGSAVTSYAPQSNPIPAGLPAPKTVTTMPTGAADTRSSAPAQAAAPAAPAATQEANARASTSDAGGSGAYVVQVASQRSQADAMGSWRALQARYPNLLGSYQATVKRADLGERGVYYRAQVGPFASRDQANNLCQALRAQGGDCVVTRN